MRRIGESPARCDSRDRPVPSRQVGAAPLQAAPASRRGEHFDAIAKALWPICFADSGHQPDGDSITSEQCAAMLDAFGVAEAKVVMSLRPGGAAHTHATSVVGQGAW
jgi:hypothetical protein